MAKKSAIEKNNRRKKISSLAFNKRLKLKNAIYDKTTSLSERFASVMRLSALSRNSSVTRIRNRCEITGRPRGYYRKFKVSRNVLRRLVGLGFVCGVTKSSW